MEEILKQILSEVSALKDGQQKMITRIDKFETKVDNIETKLDKLEIKVDNVETKVDNLEKKVDNVSGQQEENTQMIKAICHNTETTNAEVNALKLTTLSKEALSHLSTKEDINKLNAKFEVLNSRLFHQEAELYELKAVK